MAGWQSGYAAACKAVDAGSIPTPASNPSKVVPAQAGIGARVAKLVDARDLKSLGRKAMLVRIRPRAPYKTSSYSSSALARRIPLPSLAQ